MSERLHQKDDGPEPQREDDYKRECEQNIRVLFGKFLKKARNKAGYTQAVTADCLDYNNVKMVSRHETGRNFPTLLDFIGYSILYNITDISDVISNISEGDLDEIFGSKLNEEATARNDSVLDKEQEDIERQLGVLESTIRDKKISPQQITVLINLVMVMNQGNDK